MTGTKKRRQSGISDNGPRRLGWLTTFNDMVTLLMVFFVLLFSMGSLDLKRFKTFQNSLQSAMGIMNEGHYAPVGTIDDENLSDEQMPVTAAGDESSASDGTVSNDATGRLDDLETSPGLEAEYTPKGIQLTLNDNLLFASASDRLTAQGRRMLEKIGKVIEPLRRSVRVEGHTDNIPINTERFPTNWELSTARAIAVVRFFQNNTGIAPGRLSAAGYADLKPRAGNDSAADRARNRRVEIILGRVIAKKAETETKGL